MGSLRRNIEPRASGALGELIVFLGTLAAAVMAAASVLWGGRPRRGDGGQVF